MAIIGVHDGRSVWHRHCGRHRRIGFGVGHRGRRRRAGAFSAKRVHRADTECLTIPRGAVHHFDGSIRALFAFEGHETAPSGHRSGWITEDFG